MSETSNIKLETMEAMHHVVQAICKVRRMRLAAKDERLKVLLDAQLRSLHDAAKSLSFMVKLESETGNS